METTSTLPLPLEALPEAIRRFCDPAAPSGARLMASRGVVPGIKGEDLVTLLAQLAADPNASIADSARHTLERLPPAVIHTACTATLHPAILDGLATWLGADEDALERIVANQATADFTVERVAKACGDRICERIATNEQRVLRAPRVIEALYHNPSTRMSTADRLIDLAARNGVDLPGIPSFKAHAEALAGQLIPEPSEEPLPDDQAFHAALAEDEDDPDAIEQDYEKETEKLKDKYVPLHKKVADMTTPQKIRFATIGNAAARALLLRDPQKVVANAAIMSPRMTAAEAAAISKSKEVGEDILRQIGRRKDWVQNYEVKRGLVFNPKTPIATALSWLGHLRDNDLKILSRSRGVPGPVKSAAIQRTQKKGRS